MTKYSINIDVGSVTNHFKCLLEIYNAKNWSFCYFLSGSIIIPFQLHLTIES